MGFIRFHVGFIKVSSRMWVSSRFYVGLINAPLIVSSRFHVGFMKVSCGFHQGFIKDVGFIKVLCGFHQCPSYPKYDLFMWVSSMFDVGFMKILCGFH